MQDSTSGTAKDLLKQGKYGMIYFSYKKSSFMDSINKQQPEHNREDLDGTEAVKKLKDLAEKAGSCFFCTNVRSANTFDARPMAVQEVDDQGNFWFLSASDSHKNAELETDPFVKLLFQGSGHSDFLTVSGTAKVTKDPAKIKELWNPMVKTWFTEGKDDPRITVIEVRPDDAYYWDTKHNRAIAFVKQVTGALIGQTIDDSVEGHLHP